MDNRQNHHLLQCGIPLHMHVKRGKYFFFLVVTFYFFILDTFLGNLCTTIFGG